MQGNRHKGGYGFLVVGMGMEFDAIGKDPPHVETDIATVLVLAATNAPANVSEIDGMGDNLGVGRRELWVGINIK